MMVIRISTENRAADHSNQPNPKSYASRKLASDKENSYQQHNNLLLAQYQFLFVVKNEGSRENNLDILASIFS